MFPIQAVLFLIATAFASPSVDPVLLEHAPDAVKADLAAQAAALEAMDAQVKAAADAIGDAKT